MTSHHIAIAKASFTASLLKPDPTSINRDEISRFHNLLGEALTRCSTANVQSCKDWIAQHLIPSTARIISFGKYITALSASFEQAPLDGSESIATGNQTKPSAKRKRLYALYLLNDLLHHLKYHLGTTSSLSTFTSIIQPYLLSLFTLAASYDATKNPKHCNKLGALLGIWEECVYFEKDYIGNLREVVRGANDPEARDAVPENEAPPTASVTDGLQKAGKEAPYIMPLNHGDPSTPFFDLPAANLIPHVVPNSTAPIRTQNVKALQFVAGPADPGLARLVQDFLVDVGRIYQPDSQDIDEGIVQDIDEMGQPLKKDEMTGEIVPTESYYGWSVGFCERITKAKRGDGKLEFYGVSGNGNSDNDSGNHTKRRRYSSADSSRSRSRSRGRAAFGRRSRSHSRSPHRPGFRSAPRRSPSRSQSPPARFSNHKPSALPPSILPAQSARPPLPQSRSFLLANASGSFATPVDQISDPFATQAPAAPGPPGPMPHNFPLGPNGLPLPPPPPFHTGPWPPPPPPGPGGVVLPPQFGRGFVPPPPLAPPGLGQGWNTPGPQGHAQGQYQQGQQGYAQGQQGYGGNAGGGYGRDRGGDRGGWQQSSRDPRRDPRRYG